MPPPPPPKKQTNKQIQIKLYFPPNPVFYSLTASKRAEVCLSGHILVHYGAADDTTFNPFPNGTIKIKFHRAGKTTWRNYITQKSFLKEEEGKKRAHPWLTETLF